MLLYRKVRTYTEEEQRTIISLYKKWFETDDVMVMTEDEWVSDEDNLFVGCEDIHGVYKNLRSLYTSYIGMLSSATSLEDLSFKEEMYYDLLVEFLPDKGKGDYDYKVYGDGLYEYVSENVPFRVVVREERRFTDKGELVEYLKNNSDSVWYKTPNELHTDFDDANGYSDELGGMIDAVYRIYGEDLLFCV